MAPKIDTETPDDVDFLRQDAILQKEEALKKKQMNNVNNGERPFEITIFVLA